MFTHYLNAALRHFRQHKLTTSINVVGLALGIACFIVAYAIVGYLRSSEAALPNASRTYFLAHLGNGKIPMTAEALAKHLRLDSPDLAVARAIGGPAFSLGSDTHSLRVGELASGVSPVFVDPEFLDIFALEFIAGDRARALTSPRSLVLSEQAARKFFGTTDVVGRRVTLNREDVTITGVVAPPQQPSHLSDSPVSMMRFDMLASMDVYDRWRQVQFGIDLQRDRWTNFTYLTYVQLPADGSVTAALLSSRLASFGERMPPESRERTVAARPIAALTASFGDALIGSIAALFMSLGGLVLFVACLNYANLATAQAASRVKEVGMRKVLGAKRRQVMGQHFFETALLTSTACALALFVVLLLTGALRASQGIDLNLVLTQSLSFWVFLLTVIAGVTVVAGAYPALVVSALRPVHTLRAGRSRSGGRRFAGWLVGVQFAIASTFVIAVCMMYRQNAALHDLSAIESDQVVVLQPALKTAGVSLETLKAMLASSVSIKGVSATRVPPWSLATSTWVVARNVEGLGQAEDIRINSVAHDFFQAFDMKLLAGRLFDPSFRDDSTAAGARVSANIVVDRAFTAHLGYDDPAEAVGTTVYARAANPSAPPEQARIVGVVETRQMGVLGFWGPANIYSLDTTTAGYALVRISRTDVPTALAAIDAAWSELAPDTALKRTFADELFERAYRYFDGTRRAFTAIAALAFVIAAMGLIGMAVHIVGSRRHEIGVRKTLGASQPRVLAMMMWDFSRPVLVANLIAWPLVAAMEQGYVRVLVERASISLTPYVLGLVITLVIAWIAVVGQAMRASRVRPAEVMRYE